MYVDPYAHSASIEVAVDAKTAFDFKASGRMQTYWTLGSWDRVGADREAMLKVDSARVRGGEELGREPGTCIITLNSWRSGKATDVAWERGAHVYKTEMHLIKGRLENEIDAVSVKS